MLEKQDEDLTYYGPEKHLKPVPDAPRLERPARPTEQQLAFMDWELGLFIHYGLRTYTGKASDPLKRLPSQFKPTELDCDNWMRVAKAMGATYAVLTTRHEGGFCNWPTKTTEFCVRNSSWKDGKGDVVREFVDACRRHGMKVGFYHTASHDAHHRHLVETGEMTEEQYTRMQVEQIRELFTQYGPIDYIWQDHHSAGDLWKRVDDTIRELQPDCVVFGLDTWITGGHSGYCKYPAWYAVHTTDGIIYSRPKTEDGQPDGAFFCAWEANHCMSGDWFWRGPQKPSYEAILDRYYKSVGRGANLLINFAPDPAGRMPSDILACARAFGDAVRERFAGPLASSQGTGRVVELDLRSREDVGMVVVMEDLSAGQRIAEYAIEAEVEGDWKQIAADRTVGHKKIDFIDPPVRTRRIRFVCRQVAPGADMEDVSIRKLTAYRTLARPESGAR